MDDFENSENISNEIMSSMKLKDEIIGDLYNKLEFEMNENNVLRNKLKERQLCLNGFISKLSKCKIIS